MYSKLGTNKFKSLSKDELTDKIDAIKIISGLFPLGFTCLPQALALKYYLKSDKEAKLIIGVKKENNELTAHAWVEKNKEYLIGDTPYQTYLPIWEWA